MTTRQETLIEKLRDGFGGNWKSVSIGGAGEECLTYLPFYGRISFTPTTDMRFADAEVRGMRADIVAALREEADRLEAM
jgi:hypothetical protein